MAKLDSITAMVAKHPKAAAKALAKLGKGQDTVLAHLEPWEARLLDKATDGGAIHPRTGLPMFEDGDGTGTSGGGGGEGGDNGVGGNDSSSGGASGGGGGGGGTAGGGVGGDTSFGGWGSDPSMGPSGRDDAIGGGVGGDTSFSNWTDDPSMGPNAREDQISERAGGVDWSQYDMQRTFVDHTPSPRSNLSPVAVAPQRPAVRKAVDAWNNTIGKVTGFRQEVHANPETGLNQARNFLDISPISVLGGMITGLPVGPMMDYADIKDPFGFTVDMGFGTDTPAGPGNSDGADAYARIGASKSVRSGAAPALNNPGTLTPVAPGSSYVPPTPLSSVTPVNQTKLRARRGMAGDYAPNFRTSAV